MTALPKFLLEGNLAKREFTAQHNLSASDAQSVSLSELLALARAEDRSAFENVRIGYPGYLGRDGAECFTARLVDEAGVLLLPSSIYRSKRDPR